MVSQYKRNPRQMTKRQDDALAASLDALGDLGGIVHDLNSDEIIGGNQRGRLFTIIGKTVEQLRQDGQLVIEHEQEPDRQGTVALGYILWQGARYAYRAVRWTAEQCAAANIKANLLGGSWDWDSLASWDAGELMQYGFDADLLNDWNREAAGLATMLQSEEAPSVDAPAQVDKAELLQEKWQVQSGQIWQCGEHFIICGDCREPETWKRLLAAAGVEKVNGVFTSPPYAEQRKEQYGGVPTDEYVEWWDAVQANVKASLANDGSFFVNIKPHCEDGQRVLYVFDLVLAMVRRWGWRFVDELCWKRVTSPGTWTNKFKNYFEPIYHFSLITNCKFVPESVLQDFVADPHDYKTYDRKTANKYRPSGFDTIGSMKSSKYDGAFPSNVIEASGVMGGEHWAAFPVALSAFFVKAYSDEGDLWLDPFLGSGTTIVAAHNNKRRGLGIEKLEKYVAVCLERLQGIGLEPRLVESGA